MTMTALSDAKQRLLAQALAGRAVVAQRDPPITPRAEGVAAPLTAEQRHVWLHAAQAPERPLYNEPCTIIRRGRLDSRALQLAFNRILQRHEIWRTAFEIVDGEMVQRVLPQVDLPLVTHDLSCLPAEHQAAETRRLAAADAHRPFDLAEPPLLRALLITLGPTEHRLFLTLHHMILDGISIGQVLIPELIALYEAFVADRDPDLAPVTLQYGDVAAWRADHPDEARTRQQLDYWKVQLAGGPPDLRMPTDRPRPRTPSYGGSMETFLLPPALVERLTSLGQAEGATLYAVLNAGLAALAHRYTGQDDVSLGGLVDTRRRAELRGVMGYFLNAVVLRTRPSPDLTFRELLAQSSAAIIGALSASDVPFDEVVRQQQPTREAARHPLFQTMLVLEPPTIFPEGWDVVQTEVVLNAAKFDLYLEFEGRPQGLSGRLIYSTDLYDAATIRRMIGHLRNLLEGAAANPSARLADLPLVGPDEAQSLLAQGQGPRVAPEHDAVAPWFNAQVRATPEAVAVEIGAHRWTYRELQRRAGEIASALKELDLGPEPLVGVCLNRSFDMVAALLAIGQIGGAFLPLDPAFPAGRLAMIVDDAAPAALLTEGALRDLLPGLGVPRLLCEDIGRIHAPTPPVPADPRRLAYVIYTSGSTGRPKGVEITQGALVNLLRSMQREPGFGAQDRLLAVTTLSFDIAMLELLLPLVSGGCVVLASREEAVDPTRLAALIETSRCTVLQATPATWRALIEAGWSGRPDLKALCGGEALTPVLAEAMLSRCGSLWNVYGPTETTIWSTVARVTPGQARISIGRPIDNTDVHVLEAGGRLAATGVSGELCIGGLGLARGYRGQDALTAERFVELPGAGGARVYRTGDQARWTSDGRLECLGRLDNQVKVRGFRIELEEVESVLARHPALAAAAVNVVVDAGGEPNLVGYVVPKGEAPAPAEMRRFLQKTLPHYMIPTHWVVLDTLPMTPNRKVDRKALPSPSAPVEDRIFTAPSAPFEPDLAAIWETVLGVAPISVDDNFFDLGGHSLLVAKLFREVEARFGRKFGMAAIFDAPDVRSMAAMLAEVRAESRTVNLQTKGSRPQLLWFDAGPAFLPLSAALGREQPFLGVNLDEAEEQQLGVDFSVDSLADHLLQTVRAVQPSGPYLLGGYCNWGLVAHAAARQLMAQGEQVALLCMIHAAHPTAHGGHRQWRIEVSKARQHLAAAWRQGGRGILRYASTRARNALQRYGQWAERGGVPEPASPFRAQLARACRVYEPGRYEGPVAMFQPADRPRIMEFASAWAEVIDADFVAFDSPGDHVSMLADPNAQRLGALMSEALATAVSALAKPVRQATG
jgi:amino acid adenylation domain-containing protein